MKSPFLSLLFALLLVSCSKNEDQLLKEAREAEGQKNFAVAIERYQEIVDRFPGSANAESCLVRTASICSDELHDIERSVSTYKKIYSLFPTSKNAPVAMFLAGFLLSNELHKLDSAKVIYETFLQKYPDDKLAASARFELATLGKDPGEFIHPDTVSADAAASGDSSRVSRQ